MDIYNYKYMDSLFLDEYKAMDNMETCCSLPLKFEEINEAVVLPFRVNGQQKQAGVTDENGNYVALSAFEALSPVDSWGGAYPVDEGIERRDEEVVYFGRFWKHWGHFLMDMVSRLWYVLEQEEKVKIVYDATQEIDGVYLQFLQLLGIEKEQLIRVDVPTRFAKAIVPECSHKPGIACYDAYKRLFDVAAEAALAQFEKRGYYLGKSIYFTRGELKRNPYEVGEKEIEDAFLRNGFLRIAPEQYSLIEQIAMIREAETIACLAGTLPHNMMFAKDHANLIIVRKTNKPNYRQVDVNEIRELQVCNIDAHISLHAVGPAGPFIVDYNENVKRFFEECYGDTFYAPFSQWWKRKKKLMWYVPRYFMRNFHRNREVPIYDGKGFSTIPDAKKRLFDFYIKRI